MLHIPGNQRGLHPQTWLPLLLTWAFQRQVPFPGPTPKILEPCSQLPGALPGYQKHRLQGCLGPEDMLYRLDHLESSYLRLINWPTGLGSPLATQSLGCWQAQHCASSLATGKCPAACTHFILLPEALPASRFTAG